MVTTPPQAPPPLRLPRELLGGRLAASTVAKYTRDCLAYVTFCGGDSATALQAATLRRWRTYLVEDTPLSPHTINRLLDVHFVSPTPVHSPLGVGAQHAAPLQRPYGYWRCIYETDI